MVTSVLRGVDPRLGRATAGVRCFGGSMAPGSSLVTGASIPTGRAEFIGRGTGALPTRRRVRGSARQSPGLCPTERSFVMRPAARLGCMARMAIATGSPTPRRITASVATAPRSTTGRSGMSRRCPTWSVQGPRARHRPRLPHRRRLLRLHRRRLHHLHHLQIRIRGRMRATWWLSTTATGAWVWRSMLVGRQGATR